MSQESVLLNLEPALIWRHFNMLCETPRPSYHEEAVLTKIKHWADELSLHYEQDEFGNLLIKKSATQGCESWPIVALQGHVDMVPQKIAQSTHDFTQNSLDIYIDEGWVKARGTTLGADNGIGVAAAMAVLESTDVQHGPLEVLLTTEEETSMGGATALKAGWLKASYLINLDSEDQGDIYIGCAGGVDVNVSKVFETQPLDGELFDLRISGLQGGHSGLDINSGRSSACVLLGEALQLLSASVPDVRLISLEAGTLRNAIARDGNATLCVPHDQVNAVRATVAEFEKTLRPLLHERDAGLMLELTSLESSMHEGLSAEHSRELIQFLFTLPHGVHRMAPSADGRMDVIDTSNNLGTIKLEQGQFNACLLVRSLCDARTLKVANQIHSLSDFAGFESQSDCFYPAWQPNYKSQLMDWFQEVHQVGSGILANVKVIHAGLECGIIGSKYPDMQMISFGPNIRGAHSPDERLEVATVAPFWALLVELLSRIKH